jgi:non-ribosomal peptide synthetase-like protein
VLMPGADIGSDAEIEPGSVVSGRVPEQERWAGSPARRIGEADGTWPSGSPRPGRRRGFWRAMYGVGLAGLGLLGIVSAVPGLLALDALGGLSGSLTGTVTALLVASPLLAAIFVVTEAVLVALAFRAVSRLIRPGLHGDDGATAWALWLCGEIAEGAQKALFPLYATVYTRAWLRLHGLPVGRRAEVSTAEGLNPLVTLGETAFVADHPMFAGAQAHRGWIRVEPIAVGERTFVGNGAILTGGATIGRDCIVGIETNAPAHAPDETSWFGAPALELPRVRDCAAVPERTTDPPRRLVLARGLTEIVRILLPTSLTLVLGALVLLALDRIGALAGAGAEIAAAPAAVLAASLLAVLATVAVKWLIIGRYRAGQSPLWSSLVWRDEIVNSCQEQLAGEWIMEKALGTPLLSLYLRAMGARVGRDVWCETLAVTEFDVVTLRDGVAVNRGACMETHLFHDRLLRIGPAEMGPGSTLGPVSAVLPDTTVGAGCVIGGRSVVMRGEELPAGTRWHGAPVVSSA